jgi:sulfopyruvate decarboxylase TPP-binding subunit
MVAACCKPCDLRGRRDGRGFECPKVEIVRDVLKRHKVSLVTYVPDNVLRPLIEGVEADTFFTAFVCTREEEALGIVAGAWMGGLRGTLLMRPPASRPCRM